MELFAHRVQLNTVTEANCEHRRVSVNLIRSCSADDLADRIVAFMVRIELCAERESLDDLAQLLSPFTSESVRQPLGHLHPSGDFARIHLVDPLV